jgi:ATP-dependent exoDNAse (exonuclease V) beta subunit
MKLQQLNKHPRDDNITFEESTHTYTINGDSNYKSVTTWIHSFFPNFEADVIIQKIKSSTSWGPEHKYYGYSNEEIKNIWSNLGKEASQAGTNMHLNIEYYYNDIPFTKDFEKSAEYNLFQKYLNDHQEYIPFRTEWAVYTKVYKLAGSIDMVYYDPKYNDSNKVIIADWKRSKEIKFTNKWEKGLKPINNIDNCNYWHYTLQLNIYRMILEKYYSKQVTEMFLVIIHPNNDNYVKVPINRITEPIQKMLEYRKLELQ